MAWVAAGVVPARRAPPGWATCSRRGVCNRKFPAAQASAPSKSFERLSLGVAEVPIVLCLRMKSSDEALHAAEAAIRGGVRVIEVTLTTPGALDVIEKLVSLDECIVGAGTAVTANDVIQAAEAGAEFAMSPIANREIVDACRETGIVPIPGAATPTEIYHAAVELGAPIVKVFPISTCGGPKFIRAIGGPFPDVQLLPASGVEFDQLDDFLALPNVFAVGASKQIVQAGAVRHSQWSSITSEAARWAERCRQLGQVHTSR